MSRAYTLITGASSGMGSYCAERLSDSHNLILSGSNSDKLSATLSRCQNKEKHLVWVYDLAKDKNSIGTTLVEFLKENDAVVDNFIHFAGLTQILPLKSFSIENIDKLFNVNLFSAIEIIKTLLKLVNKKTLSNIVMISGIVTVRGDIGNSIYASTKGAINSLVYSLARELAPKVRVNAVMPGLIDTPMAQGIDEKFREDVWNRIPLGKGEPSDIVNYVEYLISDKARWITGQTALVDGGQSLCF